LHQLRRLGERRGERRGRARIVPRNVLAQDGEQVRLAVLRRLPLARHGEAVHRDEAADQGGERDPREGEEHAAQVLLRRVGGALQLRIAERINHLTKEEHEQRLQRTEAERGDRADRHEDHVVRRREPEELAHRDLHRRLGFAHRERLATDSSTIRARRSCRHELQQRTQCP
jgi:hypothetical protein